MNKQIDKILEIKKEDKSKVRKSMMINIIIYRQIQSQHTKQPDRQTDYDDLFINQKQIKRLSIQKQSKCKEMDGF